MQYIIESFFGFFLINRYDRPALPQKRHSLSYRCCYRVKAIFPTDFKMHRDGKGVNPREHR